MTTSQRIADIAAPVSVVTATTSWLSNAHEIVSIIAALVAIIAGVFSIAVHVDRLKRR